MARTLQKEVWFGVVFAAILLLAYSARAQGVSSKLTDPQTVTDVLQQMSSRAGVIFSGQVVAVRRASARSGVVEVDFRVDTAIRGCRTGVYTLREWAGLWVVDDQRYHMGQHLLMLLHAPSAAGLSSPVDGLDGAIPIRQGGGATPYKGTAVPVRVVDLRWLGAKLPRTVSYRRESSANTGNPTLPVPFIATPQNFASMSQTIVPMRADSAATATLIAPLTAAAAEGSVPAQEASVDAVVTMLMAWEKARHVAP